jgi:hypothetical protein
VAAVRVVRLDSPGFMASRSRKIIVRSLLGSVLVLLVAGLSLVYLVRRTPAWFAKIEMTEAQALDEINNTQSQFIGLQNFMDGASTQPTESTFTFTITESQIHAFYVQRSGDTDTTKLIASKVQDPQVRMRDGQFILAGRVPGIESVVNARFAFEKKPDGSGGVFKLTGIYGGSLPMPDGLIAGQRDFVIRALDGEVSRRRSDVKTNPPDETTLKLLTAINAIDLLNGKPVESTVILRKGGIGGSFDYARVIDAKFDDGKAVLTFRLANEKEIAEVVQRVKKGN